MTFHLMVRPRYGEVDMQGVVFNAHWLAYFDDAVSQFFAWLGYEPKESFADDFDFMVVKAAIEWSGAAGFRDEIDIEVTPVRLGNSSFDLTHLARVDGHTVCTATITYVLTEAGANKSKPIPGDLRARLEAAAPTAG